MKSTSFKDFRGILAGAVALIAFCFLYDYLYLLGSLLVAAVVFLGLGDPKRFIATAMEVPRLYTKHSERIHTFAATVLLWHVIAIGLHYAVGGGWNSVADFRAYIASALIVGIGIWSYEIEALDEMQNSEWPFFELPWWCALIVAPYCFIRLLWLWGSLAADIIYDSLRSSKTQEQ